MTEKQSLPEVHGEHGVPLLLGHCREGLVPQDACVSDKDVNSTKLLQGDLDNGLAVFSRAYRSGCLSTS